MAHTVQWLACLVILAVTSAEKQSSRWSRQISSYTSDISDWVPLAGPVQREPLPPPPTQIKRQAVAEPRILTEPFPGFTRPTGFSQDQFPQRTYFNSPANRQLYLQSVPSAPQNYLSDQGFGQSIRFGLSQPNFPLTQGFVSPQFSFDTAPQIKQRPQAPQVKFENFPKPNLPAQQVKPFINQSLRKPDSPKFVDGYRIENISNTNIPKKKPQSLQKLKFDNYDKVPKVETIAPNQKVEKEEVQLLYVPLESLNRGQFNFRSPITSPQFINSDLYSQGLPRPSPLKPTFAVDLMRPMVKQADNYNQDYFKDFNMQLKDLDQVPKYTSSSPFPTVPINTTPKPKKLKPHQPPLAIFLTQEARRGNQIKVGDVLSSLKSASTIAVLDAVNPLNAPKVFIGPNTLPPPENYVKFELPYLSNIENTEKKLKQLPFFVAPLSYSTPQGFAKIPFPSPHVGSVVINSLIKESPTTTTTTQQTHLIQNADIIPNSYYSLAPSPPLQKDQQRPATQKPNYTYYSTAPPKTHSPPNYSNYYSFEQQTVNPVKPPIEPEAVITASPKPGSYFLADIGTQYNPSQIVSFPTDNKVRTPQPVQAFNIESERTTSKTTTSTTTKTPSTYPSQLLETHNPYSINQAFHFSTPLDYNTYFEEYKEGHATPGYNHPSTASPVPVDTSSNPPPKTEEVITEKPKYQQQSSPNYLQAYTPEIHYQSDVQNSRYPVYNTNDYTTKTETALDYSHSVEKSENSEPINNANLQPDYDINTETKPSFYENFTEIINKVPEIDVLTTRPTYVPHQYDTSYGSEENQPTTTTTTTTTTRRTPIRGRGRPRYTTTPRTDKNEYSTRTVITRRPLRERKPLPTRNRYEPNKITTDKSRSKSEESSESTTKSSRTRIRGRIHYKPSEDEEGYDKRNKGNNRKEADLAYQRDVLHQNYPVTLMERMSTADIEAITEPSPKISSTKNLDVSTESSDTENAYSNDRVSFSQPTSETGSKEDTYTITEAPTEALYVPKLSTRVEEYSYQSRSSSAPVDALSYDEISAENDNYSKQTTREFKNGSPEVSYYSTEPTTSVSEQNVPNISINNEQSSFIQEELSTTPDTEITKKASQESNQDSEEEDSLGEVQTTPSYNRVRVRPGVIRQYHQASSTETTRSKTDRRRPVHAVTYRPAFDRRRTTMRIEEIEADLKTKQVHSRPETQDYKYPVYKPETRPETTTESQSLEATTKRGHFRRRRPTYTTTTTEASESRKKNYEVKNRFRGRRPTEKPSEIPDLQTEVPSSTVRNAPYSRYSHRPRLSERYNKKSESEDVEDQDSNYSINRPKYAPPESDQWSPKISVDSFKPFNPNNIVEDKKIATTERRSSGEMESELDIITAKNEFEDILISVTPATNNRNIKKIPDIPPTLEALVEQSKVTKSDAGDNMSTFESMLEEVMKSLEEQDEDEYTTNVMKHKGGEIGEIPPDRVITSEDNNSGRPATIQEEVTTVQPTENDSTFLSEDEIARKSHRRGFWKKIKVRPVKETIDVAESQYYSNTVNKLGQPVKPSKTLHDKGPSKSKITVTTYKPNFEFLKHIFDSEDESDPIAENNIHKLENKTLEHETNITKSVHTETKTTTETQNNPGDFDLGTATPDPTIDDVYNTSTEPITEETALTNIDRSDGFSLMDYLFGVTSNDDILTETQNKEADSNDKTSDIQITEATKLKTTESSYIPEEMTTVSGVDNLENVTELIDNNKMNVNIEEKVESTEKSVRFETSSVSSFMDPVNVLSTSLSTEISHETEICFRGRCIKTSKDVL